WEFVMNEERRHHLRRFTDRSTAVAAAMEQPRSRVSWGALFAGVVVALATQLLLAALGMAIGFTALDPGDRGSAFGVGAGIWWLLSGLIALFLGGWTAGRLANPTRKLDASLHGFATWALATLISAWMLTSAVGGVMGGAWSAVSTAATTTATTAAARPDLADRAGDLLRQAGVDPSQADELASRLKGEANSPQAQAEARQAADKAKEAASTASWFLFGMLLLGAAAATIGGAKGAPEIIDELDVRSQPERRTSAAS
ncbi:MAG TPA: hypothetical protein VFV75_14530, partial [Candidatus Polarisedimenticolaceae bacterium]|nr:hypothetical protein [Candidatus Polarisedimenticolaceae bacterium]